MAGAIFTIPAFVMVEMDGVRLWTDLRGHYWEATVILLAGGLIGVFFIILLRRPLCVEANLPWPESVASAEIVKAGQESQRRAALHVRRDGLRRPDPDSEKRTRAADLPRVSRRLPGLPAARWCSTSTWRAKPIGEVAHAGGIPWSTPSLSPALIGIGYIIGPQLASINVAGGVLAWWVLIPLLLFFDPDLGRRLGGRRRDPGGALVHALVQRGAADRGGDHAGGRLLHAARHARVDRALAQGRAGGLARRRRTRARRSSAPSATSRVKWVLAAIAALLIPVTGDLLPLHRRAGRRPWSPRW